MSFVAIDNLNIFALLKDALRPFVETTKKGVFSTAGDQLEVLQLLGESPGRFRVILAWEGEETIGQHSSGIVQHEIHVIVSHNRGLSILRGENLSVRRADDPSLMALTNEVRDLVRSLVLPNLRTSKLFEYGGAKAVVVEGTPIDAYRLTFAIKAAIPEPEYTPVS